MTTSTLPRTWSTARLVLRPFELADVDDVFAYAQDPVWAEYLPTPVPYERDDAEHFVASQLLADHASAPRWAIQREGAVVGAIELSIDRAAGVATAHYAIARPHWGQGLMTEALRSVLDRAFGDLPELARLQSFADVRNKGSWRVMEKAGLQREGVARSCRSVRGERIDDVTYAVLRVDWQSTRRA